MSYQRRILVSGMVPSTKGLGFQRVLEYAQHAHGDDAPKRLIDSLPKEDQQALASIVSVGWYALDFYARLLHQLVQVLGHGDMAMLEDYGRFAAKQDIGTVHRLLFKITSPGLILDQAMKLWNRFHNTGSWSIERGDHSVLGTLSDWGCVDETLCRELVGYLEATVAHGHGKGVRMEHIKCRARGAAACVFKCTWR